MSAMFHNVCDVCDVDTVATLCHQGSGAMVVRMTYTTCCLCCVKGANNETMYPDNTCAYCQTDYCVLRLCIMQESRCVVCSVLCVVCGVSCVEFVPKVDIAWLAWLADGCVCKYNIFHGVQRSLLTSSLTSLHLF